mgnify:CR=1 FL=1|jgi:hypothetical protein
MIDWQEIIEYANESYGMSFKTLGGLLRRLYRETGSTMDMCEILGISHHSLRIKMKKAGIKIAPRGGANYKGIYKPIIMDMPRKKIAKMNLTQLVKEIGCTRRYLRVLLKKENIEYIKGEMNVSKHNK